MKRLAFLLFVAVSVTSFGEQPSKPASKPDFYSFNPDGSVKLHGVYQTDAQGRVSRYTVYDGARRLMYTETAYYATDGRIIRADHLDAEGRIEFVLIYYDLFSVRLDASGNVVSKSSFSQKEFLNTLPKN